MAWIGFSGSVPISEPSRDWSWSACIGLFLAMVRVDSCPIVRGQAGPSGSSACTGPRAWITIAGHGRSCKGVRRRSDRQNPVDHLNLPRPDRWLSNLTGERPLIRRALGDGSPENLLSGLTVLRSSAPCAPTSREVCAAAPAAVGSAGLRLLRQGCRQVGAAGGVRPLHHRSLVDLSDQGGFRHPVLAVLRRAEILEAQSIGLPLAHL